MTAIRAHTRAFYLDLALVCSSNSWHLSVACSLLTNQTIPAETITHVTMLEFDREGAPIREHLVWDRTLVECKPSKCYSTITSQPHMFLHHTVRRGIRIKTRFFRCEKPG